MPPLPIPLLYYYTAADPSSPLMVDSPMSGNWVVYLMGLMLAFFLIRNLNRIEKLLAQHTVEIRSVQDEQLKQKILNSPEYIEGTAQRMSNIVLDKLMRYNAMMPSERPEKE